VSVMAYHSFGGEVEASSTPTIRRLIPSCRHQLSPIAHLRGAIMPNERKVWPAFTVGVGLLATVVWTLFLGWLISHAVLGIL
jgi:hypothetical protein